ncbi:MAG: hypothetical protein LAE24_05745 [Candidatus Contendobacter sp.]|nr:hypothetical protein [Candidatus Contendobacter sp.]
MLDSGGVEWLNPSYRQKLAFLLIPHEMFDAENLIDFHLVSAFDVPHHPELTVVVPGEHHRRTVDLVFGQQYAVASGSLSDSTMSSDHGLQGSFLALWGWSGRANTSAVRSAMSVLPAPVGASSSTHPFENAGGAAAMVVGRELKRAFGIAESGQHSTIRIGRL